MGREFQILFWGILVEKDDKHVRKMAVDQKKMLSYNIFDKRTVGQCTLDRRIKFLAKNSALLYQSRGAIFDLTKLYYCNTIYTARQLEGERNHPSGEMLNSYKKWSSMLTREQDGHFLISINKGRLNYSQEIFAILKQSNKKCDIITS